MGGLAIDARRAYRLRLRYSSGEVAKIMGASRHGVNRAAHRYAREHGLEPPRKRQRPSVEVHDNAGIGEAEVRRRLAELRGEAGA